MTSPTLFANRPAAQRAHLDVSRRTRARSVILARKRIRNLWLRFGGAALVALSLAACVGGVPNQPDFAQGTWDGQTIVPPPGLLTVDQGALVGRRVDNTAGATPLTIVGAIVEPAQAQPRYALLAGPPAQQVVIVPMNALAIGPTTIQITATNYTLQTLPNFPSIVAVETHYPHTVVTTPVVVQAPNMPIGTLPPVLPAPVLGPVIAGTPLQLAHSGSVVGEPMVDSAGSPVGRVDAVAVLPATGEVRYAIVSSPAFGVGFYIAVPAAQVQAGVGQVIVTGSAAQWMQAPRFRGDQLPQAIGTVGMLN